MNSIPNNAPSVKPVTPSPGFPPIESNYTMCPNMFFDRVVGYYEPCVVNVVAILIRETLGWLNQHTGARKIEAELPLSAFVRHGMSQESARKGLRLAAAAGLILKTEQASPKDPARYALRWEDPKTQQQAIKDERRAFQAKRTRSGGLKDTFSRRITPGGRVLKSSTLKTSPLKSRVLKSRVLENTPPLNKGVLKKSYPEKKEERKKETLVPAARPDFSLSLSQEPKGQADTELARLLWRARRRVFKRVGTHPPGAASLERMIQDCMKEIQAEDAAKGGTA